MTEFEKVQATTEKARELVEEIVALNLPDTPEMQHVHREMIEYAKGLLASLTLWGVSLALTDLFDMDIQKAAEEAAADGWMQNQ
jgi:hypothetical protein